MQIATRNSKSIEIFDKSALFSCASSCVDGAVVTGETSYKSIKVLYKISAPSALETVPAGANAPLFVRSPHWAAMAISPLAQVDIFEVSEKFKYCA